MILEENYILKLIKIITALYFENMCKDKGVGVLEEIQEVLLTIKPRVKGGTAIGSEEEATEALLHTAKWMLDSLQTDKLTFSRDNIIQRLVINIHCDNQYIEVVKKYLDESVTPIDSRKRVTEIMSELRYDQKQHKIKSLIQKANHALNFERSVDDTTSYVQGLMGELETLNTKKDGEITGFVGRVNFSKLKEIEELLEKTTKTYETTGILNTGFQGLNRSTGVGGFRRGEFINFGATTHNYKSGMLIDLSLNIPVYNDPWMWDDTKKPLILRISFENTLEQDIRNMYVKVHEMKYQEECKLAEINTNKAAKVLREYFSQKGYHFALECFDANNFSIYDLFDVMNRYIQNGYEIHFTACDYLSQISSNTIGDRLDSKIQKTFEMTRNFCYPKGITFATGHQLSTEAQSLQRESTSNFTKRVCTGGWYMDCRSLHTKLDLEYILGIHKHIDGRKYLLVSRGKHRGGEATPEKHCHFARRFDPFGGILPDMGTDDKTIYKLPELLDVDSIGFND